MATFCRIYSSSFDTFFMHCLLLHFRGQVTAVVNQVTMKMQIKQMIQNNPPPELLGKSRNKID